MATGGAGAGAGAGSASSSSSASARPRKRQRKSGGSNIISEVGMDLSSMGVSMATSEGIGTMHMS